MRAVLLLILCCGSIDLSYGQSPQEIKKPIPPISNKTEGTDKPKYNSESKQAPAIDLPSSVNKSISSKLQIESEKYTGSGHDNATNLAEWLIAICAGILAFVTARLVYYTKKLWASTGDLVAGAKDTAERQLRAYVAASNVKIVEEGRPGWTRQIVDVEMRNYGQTPATSITYWVDMCAKPFPLTSAPERSQPFTDKHVGVIAPSETFTARCPIELLEGSNGYDIVHGTAAFYVYGQFLYRDSFNKEQTTNFRYMRRGLDWIIAGNMELCDEGNDAT